MDKICTHIYNHVGILHIYWDAAPCGDDWVRRRPVFCRGVCGVGVRVWQGFAGHHPPVRQRRSLCAPHVGVFGGVVVGAGHHHRVCAGHHKGVPAVGDGRFTLVGSTVLYNGFPSSSKNYMCPITKTVFTRMVQCLSDGEFGQL